MWHFKNKTVLGVHIRATDMVATNQNKNYHYFIDKIKDVLTKHDINKIFIASDSQAIVNHAINIFGNDKILSIDDIERADTFNSPVGAHDRINVNTIVYSKRKYHNYLCGREVIIDMLLLSKCNYFIRSYSAVSDMAIFFNDRMRKVYD